MQLWIEWFRGVVELRKACSRKRTFVWMCLVLVGFSIRTELLGVSSFVRSCFLKPQSYRRLLHLFHSPALKLQKLTDLWIRLVPSACVDGDILGFRPVAVAVEPGPPDRLSYLEVVGVVLARLGRRPPSVNLVVASSRQEEAPLECRSPACVGLIVDLERLARVLREDSHPSGIVSETPRS